MTTSTTIASMLRTLIWRDLRWRLLAATLLVAMPVVLVMLGFVSGVPGGASAGPSVGASAAVGVGRDYLRHLDRYWFQLPGGSAVFLPAAVLLGAAGTLVRPRRDVAYLIALPIARWQWVLWHIAASVAALALLVLASDVAFIGAAIRAGADIRVGALLMRSLGVLVASAMWIAPATALMMVARRPLVAIPVAFVLLSYMRGSRFNLDVPAKTTLAMLPAWDPWAFADPRAWSSRAPLASIAVAIAVGALGTLAALLLFERSDA